MLTQSQRGEIAKCDPDIKKVCHRNNAKIRRRKMVVDGEQEHLIRLPHPLCRNHYSLSQINALIDVTSGHGTFISHVIIP